MRRPSSSAPQAIQEADLTRHTMTHPNSVQLLGTVLAGQLLEYGHCTFALVGEEQGVHLIQPWRVTIDGAPIPMPPQALLDGLPQEDAVRKMLDQGMTESEIILALQERDRRLAAAEGDDDATER